MAGILTNIGEYRMAKQVIDIRASKGMTVAQSNEHQRRWTDKGWESATRMGNYDPSREHLNFEVVKGEIKPVDKTKTIPRQIFNPEGKRHYRP